MVKLFCRYRFVCAPPPPPPHTLSNNTHRYPQTHTYVSKYIYTAGKMPGNKRYPGFPPQPYATLQKGYSPPSSSRYRVFVRSSPTHTHTRAGALCVCLCVCVSLSLHSETAIHCGRETVMSITERSSATFSPSGITSAETLSTARDLAGCQVTRRVFTH